MISGKDVMKSAPRALHRVERTECPMTASKKAMRCTSVPSCGVCVTGILAWWVSGGVCNLRGGGGLSVHSGLVMDLDSQIST